MTTKTVVTLCVTYDERYIWVEYNGIDFFIAVKIPSKAMLLQCQETRFLEDELNLHVGLVQDKSCPTCIRVALKWVFDTESSFWQVCWHVQLTIMFGC